MVRKGLGYAAVLGIAITLLSACARIAPPPGSIPPYRESGGSGGNGGGGGY